MKLLEALYDACARRRRAVLVGYLLATLLFAGLASRLRLDSDMLNLLPNDIPAVKTVRKLQGWSERFAATMYLGMVREPEVSVETLKKFADRLGEELRASKLIVPGFTVSMDVSRLLQALPLYLDPPDLLKAGEELDRAIKARRKQGSGFFLKLDEDASADTGEKPEEALKLLLPKYARRFQADMLNGAGDDAQGAEGLARLRLKLDDEGKRLYYISNDGRMLAFVIDPIFPPYQLSRYPELERDIDAAVARARAAVPDSGRIEVWKGGAYPLQWDQRETTLADALRSGWVSGLLILIIIIATLRRFRMVLFASVALVVGLVLCAGFSYLAVGSVNVITVFLIAVLAGLGIDFGFYLATRYNMLRKAGLGTDDATREAWLETANPAFMGAMTTMVVMIVLAFGQFRGFADLGIICAIGIVTIYLAMYTLLPMLFLAFDQAPGNPAVTVASARARLDDAPAGAAPGKRWWLAVPGPIQRGALLVTLVISVAAALGARSLRFTYTGEELAVRNQRSLEIDRRILKHYGESVDQTAVLADTEERARRIHAYFQENFGKFKTIARYETLFSYLPPELDKAKQAAALEQMEPMRRAIGRLPGKSEDRDAQFALDLAKRMADPQPVGVEDLPPLLNKMYAFKQPNGEVRGYLGAIFANRWLWDFEELRTFVAEIEAIRVDGQPLELTGRAQIFLNVITIVQREAVLFSSIGVVLIFLMFWVQVRKLKFALLSMLPLLLGILWMMGLMPFLPVMGKGGLALNFVNVIAFPILTGLGVSYGVQIIYNYRVYGSAERAFQVVVRAVLGSSTTTVVGWGSLLGASMTGMRSIGWVSVLGMTTVTLCSLLVLPAVLASLDRRGWIAADLRPEAAS